MTIEHLAQALAAQLQLTRPLVCLDLEATGLQVAVDRIVQIATATVFPNGLVSTWSSLVNPEQPIPPATTAIHGITDAMVADAPTFAQVLPTLRPILAGSDLAGYNVQKFDRWMLAAEFRRAGVDDPTADARIIDAYSILVRREPRRLDDALRFYGLHDMLANRRAHEASSDVEAALAVLVAQMQTYADVPKTVDGLHAWLHPKNPDWIDADGKLVWRDGVATIAFGAQAGMSLAELASTDRGLLQWILRKDFSEEVKAIVEAALRGNFPVRGEQDAT